MPEQRTTRGIQVAISNRRPVLTDDPEYDRLLLEAHAEDPAQLQPDERAYAETLLARPETATFRSQNDPAADRARLGMPEDAPYASTMGRVLDGGESLQEKPTFALQPKRWVEENVFAPALTGVATLMGALDRPPTPGYPKDVPYTSPLRILGAANAAVPAAAGAVVDTFTGARSTAPVVDPLRAPEEQATFGGEVARRGGGRIAQGIGTLADLLVDAPSVVGAAAPLMLGAGKLAKTAKAAAAARKAALLTEETARFVTHGSSFDDIVGSLLVGGNRAGIPKSRFLESDYAHVGRMLEKYPDLADDLPYMHASEVSALSRMSDADQGEFMRLKSETTRTELIQAAAKGGEVKRHWYNFSRAAIDHLYEGDAERFATVAAALSPRTSVESATLNAATFFENWREAGRPTDRDAVLAILDRSVQKAKAVKGKPSEGKGVLEAWRNNTVTSVQEALDDIALSGPKVQSFRQNLTTKPRDTPWGPIHPGDAVTADAWKATAAKMEQATLGGNAGRSKVPELGLAKESDTTPAYLRVAADTRRAGHGMSAFVEDMLPWTGSEVQETEWSYFKTLYELAESKKMRAVDVLKQGLLTDAMIEGTPDLTLLARDRYGVQLARDPDKRGRMANIVPGTFNKPTPTSALTKSRQLEVAQIIDDTIRQRRMTTDFHVGRNKYDPDRIIAASPQEVQVSNTARMPALSPREQGQIFSASRDALGRNPVAVALHGGTNVIPAETGTGVFKSERNPLRATGSALDTDAAGNLTADAIRNQIFASRFGDGMNMQKVSVWQAVSFAPELPRDVLHVSLGSRIKEPVLQGIVNRFPSNQFGIVDRGGSLEVVRFDGGLVTPADAERLETYLEKAGGLEEPKRFTKGTRKGQRKTSQVKLGTNIAPKEAYTEMGTNAKRGSRTVTGNMMGQRGDAYDLLSPEQQAALDGPRIKYMAETILAQSRAAALRAGVKMRADVENMLTIIRDGGATALRKAMDDPTQLLPALAWLGVYGAGGSDTPETAPTARQNPSL